MARRAARTRQPAGPDANDGVFDTAAPPPPQAIARSPEPPGAPPSPPAPGSALAPGATAPPPGPVAGLAGPWYTFGLGGAMLAQNAALFFVLVGLTYAAGLAMLLWLLWFLLLCLNCSCQCQGCPSCGCEGCCDGCCCSGCNSAESTQTDDDRDAPGAGFLAATSATLFASTLRRRLDRRSLDALLAHHPDLPAFRADVVRLAGVRVCVGCLTLAPGFLLAAAALAFKPDLVPWDLALLAGVGLAMVQVVSALGWTRWRWAKVAVKSCLAAGMALALHGILASPWSPAGQIGALAALLGLALASTLPRRRRIARALAGLESLP